MSASISASRISRGVHLLRGKSFPLLPTPSKYPRWRYRSPMLSRNINLVAFLVSSIKADLPTNICCCRGTFVQVVLKGSILASATTTEICNSDRSTRAHALASVQSPGSLTFSSRISCYWLAINFLSQYIRQVSCNTLLSGFQLPWPPSCCQYALTSFNWCSIEHVISTLGGTLIARSAYQKRPTNPLDNSAIHEEIADTHSEFENRPRKEFPRYL